MTPNHAAGSLFPRRLSAAVPGILTAALLLCPGGAGRAQDAPRPVIAREKPIPAASASASAQDLVRLRLQLVRLAEQERAQDAELAALEAMAAPLAAEERALSAQLEEGRTQIGRLLAALQRLSRLPPETALARPDAPLDTLRSALMLREMVPVLRQRSEALAQSLQHLADTRQRLDEQRARITAARSTLAERRRVLDEALKRRDALPRPGGDEHRALAQQMARLGSGAGTLPQLMERMEADRHAAAAAAARREAERAEEERRLGALRDATPPQPPPQPPPPPAPSEAAPSDTAEAPLVASLPLPALPPPDTPPSVLRGGLRLPVGGRTVIAYGAPDHTGNPSRGLTIAAHPGATITAPFAGTVMFAGPFRNYGHILIVEHGNGYHSLIAGLGRIDTAVGTHVAAGEPIGRTLSPSDESAEVYFELRRHGQPTNPINGFGGPEGKGQG